MRDHDILLTGATGFLGKVVLHELIRRRESLGVKKVRLLLRANGSANVASRFAADIASSPCFANFEPGWHDDVEIISCDLAQPGAGIASQERAAIATGVTHIINCAASVQFDLPLQNAATANVATALEMLDLAKECEQLESLVSVSTAYVTPHRRDDLPIVEELAPLPAPAAELYERIMRGEIDEDELLAESGHPNTYTLTKCIAEHLLWDRHGDTPLALVRPSIISSSTHQPFAGWIDSPAAFALFAAQIGAGRMRAVIARPASRIDVIPCDAVADRLIDVAFKRTRMNGSPAAAIMHAVAGPQHSPQVRACVDSIQSFFRQNPDTRFRNRDLPASVRYLGPDGPLYRFNHWLYHERRSTSRRNAERLAIANRMFSYFTHNTFRFESSLPFDPPGFDPDAYIRTVCRGVAQYLMGADNTAVPIAGSRHPRSRKDLKWALRQEHGNLFVRSAAYVVVKKLRQCMDCVTFDLNSFETALKAVPDGARLVLVPSHRSYLDFVLCSVLMFSRPDLGIRIPHIAATSDFARIPFLSWLFLRLHAFYLERGLGREDTGLTEKVRSLVTSGRVIEFFIEGRRSRTRQFLEPRRGLLRCLQSTGETFAVLPVAFSYERLPEEGPFSVELAGGERPPMRLRDLMRWSRRASRGEIKLGRAHIACGRPVVYGPDASIRNVSREIMAELQYETVATKYHLQAFLDREKDALGDIDLAWVADAIERRGGSVLETYLQDNGVSPLHERCMRYHFEHLFYAEAEHVFAGNPAIENHIRVNRYGNFVPPDGEVEPKAPQDLRFLRALFGQVVRNYKVVSDALGDAGSPLVLNTPLAVLRARPDEQLHVPDVEGAFNDLARRNI
ncbi:MAG: SDR family oxidoreductase, partial [Gammaproteobacteria bacterium]|nr:SDR family oxidoreductase [Gammaproteobacteria bacterium]